MSVSNNTKKPTSLIVHGANVVGVKLTELLSTQKSNIVILDEFSKSTRGTIKQLKKDHKVDVYDTSAVPTLIEKIKRLDYVYVLLDQFLVLNPKIHSKKFISETNMLDSIFKLSIEQGTKVVLTTSIDLHRKIVVSTDKPADTLKEASQQTYSSVELQRYCENLAAEYHDQATLDIRITRIGEVIGEGIPLESNTVFVQMLKESITKPRISIPGEGLDYSYYIHHLDAVYGIIKALFSNKTNGEVFSLSYPEEVSVLNLAYKILEFNPKATEIAFTETDDGSHAHQIYVPAKNLSKIGWVAKVPFEQSLMETMGYFHDAYGVKWKDKPTKQDLSETKVTPAKPTPKPRADAVTPFGRFVESFTRPFGLFGAWLGDKRSNIQENKITAQGVAKFLLITTAILLLYFAFLGPVIQLLVGSGGAYYFGKKGYQEAYAMETAKAETSLERSTYFASLIESGWHGLRWIKVIPGLDGFYVETAKITTAGKHLSTGAYNLIQGVHPYAEYSKNFEPITSFGPSAGGGSREYLEELEMMEEGIPYIETASVEISLASESLSNLDMSVYPQTIASQLERLVDVTDSAQSALNSLENFAYYMPELLGKDGRQTYLVLFQNPMELRSTGGWLSSVAIVGIEHGQIRELEVKDVYDIDGQITQQIDPPQSMKDALEVSNWTLSLSNWSPDFPQSADSAEYFLILADEIVKADGVIAVDLEFVRDLVDIWGEVSVPGETEPVTKDNLYDKVIEIHREFTPGSTQKSVFLSNLANELIQTILSSPRDSWSNIVQVTATGLEEKHVLIYPHNTLVREVIDNNNWGGHVTPEPNTVFPVEWNWGGNKANHFINRSISFQANIIDEDTVNQTITVTYQNTSTVDLYPEGPYENFVRLYVPQNSTVSDIEGLTSVKVAHDENTGLDEVSGWIIVPVKGKASFSVSFTPDGENLKQAPLSVLSDGTITYELNYIKQPGLSNDPITIEVTYPESWTPTDLTNIHRELNALIQRSDLTSDKEFSLSWER